MNNNIPLIIGMSPSPKRGLSEKAFASGAPTTAALVKAVSARDGDKDELRAQYDYVNLDILRLNRSRPYIDQAEAASTLAELFRLGQLEERVIVLLGKDVCAAVARWFGQPTFHRPGIWTARHDDGWSCTVCAVDHPGRYAQKTKAVRAEHESVIRAALQIRCYPTKADFRKAYRDDYLETQKLMEYDSAILAELDEIEKLASEEVREQNWREYLYLRDYYSHPTYDPDDYE